MKGLDLHREFFLEHGRPLLEELFPAELDVLAVASVGFGSDRIGSDDEASRDHCWEPGFQVFSDRLGRDRLDEIQACLFEKLPWEFRGFRRTDCPGSANGIRAWTVDSFFESMTTFAHPPPDDVAWLDIAEEALFHVTNGEVFHDPAGAFTARRRGFSQYPESVRHFKLAARALRIDVQRYGMERCVRHGETVAAELALAAGVEEVMRFAFLVNRAYAPYNRWLHWGFRRLGVLAPHVQPILARLMDSREPVERQELYQEAEALCAEWAMGEHLARDRQFWWRDLSEGIPGPLSKFPVAGWVGAEFEYGSQFVTGKLDRLYGGAWIT